MSGPAPSPLHLTLGDHAAGCLRAACRAHGMPGGVHPIPDDLSHGPLADGRARLDYMRACFRGYDDWTFATSDAFAPWHELSRLLDDTGRRTRPALERGQRLRGQLPRHGLLVARGTSCAPAARPDPAERRTPPRRHPNAGRARRAVRLPTGARRGRARPPGRGLHAHPRSHRTPAPLGGRPDHRRADGPVRPLATGLLPSGWTPAARVVGTAMGRCDPPNIPSDLFFASRLQFLIDAGRIEADGPTTQAAATTPCVAPQPDPPAVPGPSATGSPGLESSQRPTPGMLIRSSL